MNPITRGISGKKSRANGSSLYMYCQTPHSLLNRKNQPNKKGIRSYSNKRERMTCPDTHSNDKRWNIDNLEAIRNKYAKARVIDLSDSKSRKGLNNCYSKTGYYPATSGQGRYSSHETRKQITGEVESNKPPLGNSSNYKRGSLSNTPIMKLDEQEQAKRGTFNSTVKTDHVSTNLWSLFSSAPRDVTRKK